MTHHTAEQINKSIGELERIEELYGPGPIADNAAGARRVLETLLHERLYVEFKNRPVPAGVGT